jgi:NitT/TauT family transport system permease protein
MTVLNRVRSRIAPRYRRPEVLTAAIIVGTLAIVEVGVSYGIVSPILLQKPSAVAMLLVESAATQDVQVDVWTTAQRVLITSLISAVVAAVLSVAFWQYDLLRLAYIPLLGAIFGTPLVLLYLVFVVMFGRGTAAIVAISVPLGVIPIVINATDALASVDTVLIKVSRSFDASSFQTVSKVIVPAAAPDIFAGVRIGFSYIVISVTAVEFLLVADPGLGGRISSAYFRFKTTEMFVGITLVVLLVVVAIFLLRRLEEAIQR